MVRYRPNGIIPLCTTAAESRVAWLGDLIRTLYADRRTEIKGLGLRVWFGLLIRVLCGVLQGRPQDVEEGAGVWFSHLHLWRLCIVDLKMKVGVQGLVWLRCQNVDPRCHALRCILRYKGAPAGWLAG
jgi:hypothetical protein